MLHELAPLSEADRFSALCWLDDLDKIRLAGKRQRTRVVQAIAIRRQVSESTVWNRFRAVQKKGPTALVDGRSREARRASRPLKGFIAGRPDNPEQWQQTVHNLYRDHNRNGSGVSVHEALLAKWHAWRLNPYDPALKIAGYNECPAPDRACGELHPAGWSLRNIQRMCPDKFDLAVSRQGLAKANELLPPVLTTRVGTKVGQIYMIDDMHCNQFVHFRGEQVRPLILSALDLHSGFAMSRYYRPRLTNAPEGQKEITERETLWFVLHLLTNFGYRTDTPTIFVVENAKATIREQFEEALLRVFRGQVLVHRGAISGKALRHFGGPAKGNPKFKPNKESWFNLFQNRSGALPGGIGSSPDTAPEEMAAHQRSEMVRYHQKLIDQAVQEMPMDIIMDMKMEILPWNRYVRASEIIAEAINDRTTHQLEGWKKLGYEGVEYRLPTGEWVPESRLLALPDHTRAEISAALQRGEKAYRVQPFTPRQVWQSDCQNLARLSPSMWHLLIPSHFGIRRTVPRNRQIAINDAQISAESMIFNPTATALDGTRSALPAGEEVILHINPWRPDCALVMRADGSPIGVTQRIIPQTRLDQAALLEQYAERARLKGEIGADAFEHAREIARAREAMVEHNAALGFKATGRKKIGKEKLSAAEIAAEAARVRLKQGTAPLADPAPESSEITALASGDEVEAAAAWDDLAAAGDDADAGDPTAKRIRLLSV